MARLDLIEIVHDKSIYPRSGVSEFNVGRLVAALQTGAKLPPITVDSASKRLIDGWHRFEAYKRLETKSINVTLKTYANEADLFADAVRLNVGHGEPLDNYSINNAIIRLEQYGYHREQISQVVRLPISRIEKIERGFAVNEKGQPLALKGGLSHMSGATLTEQQQIVNRHYSGGRAVFHLRQLSQMLETNMWPQTQTFADEMDRLVKLWSAIKNKASEAA
jgi:hypothetical protein